MKLSHLQEARHMGSYTFSVGYTLFDPKDKTFPYWSKQFNRFYTEKRTPKISATFETEQEAKQYLNIHKSTLEKREADQETHLSTLQGWDLLKEANRFMVVEIKQLITQV